MTIDCWVLNLHGKSRFQFDVRARCCLVRCKEQRAERESCCEKRWLLDMWGVPTGAVTRNRLVHPLWHILLCTSIMELRNGMAINTCVENFSGAVLQALAASTPKCRPRDDPRPPVPASIQDEIHLKNRLRRRWQVTRDLALKPEVNHLQRSVTRQLNEWRNNQWSATLEFLDPEDQSLWRMTKRVMRVPTPSPPPGHPGGNRSLRF